MMYQNLEYVMKPPAQRDGRTLGLAALVALLLGFLLYMTALDGDGWKSNTDSLLLIAVLAVGFIASIPLGRLRTRRIARKCFAQFTEAQLRRMDMECGELAPLSGVVVTSHALVGERHLIPNTDIVWVYSQSSAQQGFAAIHYLAVVTKDKKQRRVPLGVKAGPSRKADPQVVQEIMKQLRKKSPGIYCGYDDAIIRLYRNNFAGMIAHVEAKYAEIHGGRLCVKRRKRSANDIKTVGGSPCFSERRKRKRNL